MPLDNDGALTGTEINNVESAATDTLTATRDLIADGTSVSDAETIIDSASNLLSAANNVGAVLDGDLVDSARDLVQSALESTLNDIAETVGLSGVNFENDEATKTLLEEDSTLLSAVLEVVSVKISGTPLDQATTQSQAEASGLSTSSAASLASDFSQFVNPTGITLQGLGGSTVSASDAIIASLGGNSLSVDSDTNVVTVELDNATFPVNIAAVVIVPASIPDVLTNTPNGSILRISDGIATTIVPAPKDPVGFSKAIEDVGGGDFTTEFKSNGSIALTETATGFNFSGTFSFSDIGTSDSSTGDVTFEAPTGNVADASYSYKVNYPDGTSQNLLPFVADNDFFDSVQSLNFRASTNRSNGVISLSDNNTPATTLGFKPDYFKTPLSLTDSLLPAQQQGRWRCLSGDGCQQRWQNRL